MSLRGRWFARKSEAVPTADPAEQELLQRWRRGDQTAFAEIFRTYRGLVYGVLHRLLRGDPDVEDVVQTAFLEIFRSLDRFEGRSKLSSWMTRVALNVGYHHLRHKKSRPTDYDTEEVSEEVPDASPGADPHLALERAETKARIYAVLDTLPPRKRTVLILNDFQGMAQDEIAEIVGTNVATVRTRLFYARKEFTKKALEDSVLGPLVSAVASDPSGDGSR